MFEEFLAEKRKLNISNELPLEEITKIYRVKLNKLDNEDYLKKIFIWDYELFDSSENEMHTENGKENRLEPFPYILNFEKDRVEFYDICLKDTENVAMKIRYLDYLVDNADKNNYIYAKELVDVILDNSNIEDYKSSNECLDYISKISRVVDITVKFKMTDNFNNVEKDILDKMRKFIEIEEFRWTLEMSELLRYLCYYKNEKRISQESINMAIKLLDTCCNYYKNEKRINLHQAFCWEHIEWLKNENSYDDKVDNLLLEIGQSFEDEAEYQGGREKKSFHVKAHFLERAVNHYINIGATDKVHNLKVKIKDAYRLGRTEFEVHKFEIDSKFNEKYEMEAERFILEDIERSFYSFCISRDFIPNKQKIMKQTEEMQTNSFAYFTDIAIVSGDRKIFDAKEKNVKDKYFLYQNYGMHVQLMYSILYDKVWSKLIEQGLTCEMVAKKITEWEYLSDSGTEIIKRGIERYFDNDYISAIHILTPKFESCFRDFFTWGGYATTSIKKSATQHEQTFNDFIQNDYVKNNIDEDTLFFIQYIMVDNLGYNLRNDVAHGLADVGKFNKSIANILLYLFFVLTSLYWKIIED